MKRAILSSPLLLLAFAACGDDSKPGTETKPAALRGRVSDTTKYEGASVTVFKVDSAGMLTAASDGSAKIDAQGKYMLDVDVAAGAIENAVVRVEKGTDQASVLVAQKLESAKTIVVAPIDGETSAETDVELEARASAGADAQLDRTAIRDAVTAELATKLAAGDYTANVKAAAKAIAAETIARSAIIVEETSQEQLDAAIEARAAARAKLDAALDAGSGIEAAQETYASELEAAWATADVKTETRAAAAQAAAAAVRVYAAAATELRADLIGDLERARAASVATLVDAKMTAMGASNMSIEAVQAAGVTLQAEVDAALQANGSAIDSGLATAWANYSSAVQQKLEIELPLAQRIKLLEVQLALESAQSTLRAAFEGLSAAASASTTANAAADAVAVYRGIVLADANISTLTAAAIDAADARAMLEIVFAVSVASKDLEVPMM